MTKEEVSDKYSEYITDFGLALGLDNAYKAMDEYAKCWRSRCLAAEDYIAKSPGDPDITEAQEKAYEKWQRLVEADSDAKDELAEYAKQQAIAFDEWRIENRWFSFEQGHYYHTFEQGTSMSEVVYMKHYVKTREQLYDQFIIESQTK